VVVAGDGCVAGERLFSERPVIFGRNFVARLRQLWRAQSVYRFDHGRGSRSIGTIRSTVSSRAHISPSGLATDNRKVKRGGASVRQASTPRTYSRSISSSRS